MNRIIYPAPSFNVFKVIQVNYTLFETQDPLRIYIFLGFIMDSIEARHNNLLLLLASSIWYLISLPDVIIGFITGKNINFTNYAILEIVCGIIWESHFVLKRDFCSYRWKLKPVNSLAYLKMIKYRNETSSIIKWY